MMRQSVQMQQTVVNVRRCSLLLKCRVTVDNTELGKATSTLALETQAQTLFIVRAMKNE